MLVSSFFSEWSRGSERGIEKQIIWVLQYDDDDDDETRKYKHASAVAAVVLIPYKGFNFMFTRPKVPND